MQRIRVLGTVEKPVSGPNSGSETYAVVRKAFIE
jgi:hypothetical protein